MLISIGGLLLIFSLIIFYRFRQERKTKELIRVEKQRSETLLLNILPEETAQELKENGKALAHAYEEVSVLFADVQGFTKISENLSAEVLVQLLDRYFSAFDEIIVHFGLEKIKTIGDAYMCAGGLPIPDKSFVEMTVNAALEMQKYVEKTKVESLEKQEPYFEMRIGIHTGPVVSGVVGTKKFAYDIWGDTVNTAARIQQNSEPGKVNISRATYNLIEGKFNCTFRGRIGAKNKGDIEMYFVDYIG